MPGIKRLIPRSIATIAVAAVALALLPSPAAADHGDHHVVNGICGYTQDLYETDELGNVEHEKDANGDLVLDTNGDPIPIPSDKKYLMKYKYKGTGGNRKLVCADNTDGPNGTARPLTGSTTSASTIADIFRNRPNANRKNWCINTMFEYAARVPYDGTTTYANPDGTDSNTNEISMRTGRQNMMDVYTTWKSDARVFDFDDLVVGALFCRTGTF